MFGVVPELEALDGAREKAPDLELREVRLMAPFCDTCMKYSQLSTAPPPSVAALFICNVRGPLVCARQALATAEANITHISKYVDVPALFLAAASDPWNRGQLPLVFLLRAAGGAQPPPIPPSTPLSPQPPADPSAAKSPPLPAFSRAEIEARAAAKGAKGG